MVEKRNMMPLAFFQKEPYTGSTEGMRYRIAKEVEKKENEEVSFLEAVVYPEPYCYEATPEEDKIRKRFPFTQESLEDVRNWLNETIENK
jgi:hypothetical protein